MEPLIIPVDYRTHTLDGPPQLGITVEDPNRIRKKQQQQQQQEQQQTDFHNHDYQNLDVDILKPRGLQITKIQQGSVIHRIGQFEIGDIIVEVNGVNLQRPFAEAQRTLKQFVIGNTSHGPLILKVLRKSVKPSTPPPTSSPIGEPSTPNTPSSMGVRHRIKLKKAANGFGIKIAQRDNMHSTRNRPICITAITIAGSAYQDGRLKEGDMLLEVNGHDLQGKTQPEVTKMLKSIKTNEEVEFVISRREDGIYTYDIPLNDTKSAGLGLYLKYPCRSDSRKDLGIWIEKVITGGAAWKDGRLQQDDQILSINGIDIVGLSNVEASETLKKAAVCRGIGPEATLNIIRLRIQRRTPSVVAKILQGTNNRIECSDIITNGKVSEQSIDNPRVSCQTDFMDTLMDKTNETLSSSGSSNQNSQNDSAMSPHTQASNSLKLTNHRNDRSDQSSCDKTNETTSSAISKITDPTIDVPTNGLLDTDIATSQSWDDESVDATTYEDCFQRDGFGRQSMSEKRHAQLNAKNTDTFKRNQRLREEREQQQLGQQHLQQQQQHQQQHPQHPEQPQHPQQVHHRHQQHQQNLQYHQLQQYQQQQQHPQQPHIHHQQQQHQHHQQQHLVQQQQHYQQQQLHHHHHHHQQQHHQQQQYYQQFYYQQPHQQYYQQPPHQHQYHLPAPFQFRNETEEHLREDLITPRASVRMARNRKINESFRAAVDRSYEIDTNEPVAYPVGTIVVPVDCQVYSPDGQTRLNLSVEDANHLRNQQQQLQQHLQIQYQHNPQHQSHYQQQHHHQQFYPQQQPIRHQDFHNEVLVDALVPPQHGNRNEEHSREDSVAPRANTQFARNRKKNKSFRKTIVRPYEVIINCLTKLKTT